MRALATVVVGATLIVAGCGGGSDKSATTDVILASDASYCKQDPVVGNVDVVLAFINTGDKDATGISALPIREYAGGREVRPVGDAMVNIKVPADANVHKVTRSYNVGQGDEVAACRVKVIGTSEVEEQSIKVRRP